ncbi:hypothetical protein [Aeromicrobium sp.]|uniref:hypothetical protein n=1 Tax=Aeromicrobium sp. TaxID=1871063 RepID=UPI0019B09134|nr:hypothetical protein [Aeromicrobium sp.]MBC7630410.1 hypothetical protein [Aeromicrobium sp.]
MMSVLTLAGSPINWAKPPKSTTRVMWSRRDMYGRKVTGSLWTIALLDRTDALSVKKFGRHLVVIQPPFNTGVKASAGTHDYDACLDVYIPGVTWGTQEKFFRANGWGAYWRRPPLFGNHIHMFALPPREGKSIADDYRVFGFKVGKFVDGGWSLYGRKPYGAQIDAYYAHRDGLARNYRDTHWFPSSIESTIFDLRSYIRSKVPVVRTVRWYEHRHLNTWGDDGIEGSRTLDARRPFMLTALTSGKPEVITLNEVRPSQVAQWREGFTKAGYIVPLASAGNLVAVLKGTEVTYAKSVTMPSYAQGGGRKETVGRVRAKINGSWAQIVVTHFDFRRGAKFDAIRVQQGKYTIKLAASLARYRPMSNWKTRTSIGLTENSNTWVRDTAFKPAGFNPAVKSSLNAIYSGRAARSNKIISTRSNYPIIAVTYGKK